MRYVFFEFLFKILLKYVHCFSAFFQTSAEEFDGDEMAPRNWITDKFKNVFSMKGASKSKPPTNGGKPSAPAPTPVPAKNNYPSYHSYSPSSVPAKKAPVTTPNRNYSYGYQQAPKATGRSADSVQSSGPFHINTENIGSYVHTASDMACKYARKIVHLCDLSDNDVMSKPHV